MCEREERESENWGKEKSIGIFQGVTFGENKWK